MRYREAYDYINSFTNYEKTPGIQVDLGADELERFRLLMRLLGRPQNSFKSIVIAGSKGKGSVAAMLDSTLREAGFRTGLYTSPHLHTFRERIRVDGDMVPPDAVAHHVERIRTVVERIRGLGDPMLLPTTYELATAIAFLYFQEQHVEYAVLEVGLGGRLDAVNITEPVVSVITSISMDHMEVLGDTLGKIAAEKGGIIKPRGRVISAPQQTEVLQVLKSIADEKRAQFTVVGGEVYVGTGHLPEAISDDDGVPLYQTFTVGFEPDGTLPGGKMRVRLPLLGYHQQVNAAVTLATLRALQQTGVDLSKNTILNGLSQVVWPGRLEVVQRNPVVVLDGAHNTDSMAKLGQAMGDLFPKHDVVTIMGLSRDKNIDGILHELQRWQDGLEGPKTERLIVTKSNHPRAADPRDVAQRAVGLGLTVEIRDTLQDALVKAHALASTRKKDAESQGLLVLVTGSLFLVAEAREYYGLAPDLSDENQ
jgi:dihydrofolate synthase / folylpolyglutamate synthase